MRTSNPPVPIFPSLPITSRLLGLTKSSQSPSSTASFKKASVVSKLILVNGLTLPRRPIRLKGVNPPFRVMWSPMRFSYTPHVSSHLLGSFPINHTYMAVVHADAVAAEDGPQFENDALASRFHTVDACVHIAPLVARP